MTESSIADVKDNFAQWMVAECNSIVAQSLSPYVSDPATLPTGQPAQIACFVDSTLSNGSCQWHLFQALGTYRQTLDSIQRGELVAWSDVEKQLGAVDDLLERLLVGQQQAERVSKSAPLL